MSNTMYIVRIQNNMYPRHTQIQQVSWRWGRVGGRVSRISTKGLKLIE